MQNKSKLTAFALVFLLLFSLVPSAALAKDYLTNGSFENDLEAWVINGEGAVVSSYDNPEEGKYLTLESSAPVYVTQTASGLSAGAAYTLSADVMGESTNFAVKLEYWNGATYIDAESRTFAVPKAWEKMRFDFTVPDGAAEVKILLRLLEGGGKVLLDHVALMDEGEVPAPPEPKRDDTYTETETAAESIALLTDIGIVQGREDGSFDSAAYLTRAEAVTVILRLLGVEAPADAACTFADVPADHWATAQIAMGVDLGIVNGMSETVFAPEKCVTDTQMIKMLVCALGYDVKAKAQGGYPNGYMAVAHQLELLNGYTVSDVRLPRGDMAILAANSLEAPIFEVLSYGTDNPDYKENKTKNLLNTYLHIGKTEGVVNSNGFINFGGAPRVDAGYVMVDGEKYAAGKTDAVQKIGRKVTAYYRVENDENILLHMRQKKGTEEITLSGGDVLDKSGENAIYYEENGKERSVALDTSCVKVYNFDLVSSIAPTILTDENTSLTLVLAGGACTFLLAEQHTDFLVKNVRPDDNIVSFADGTSLTLDLTDGRKSILLTDKDGGALTLSDLREKDVLSRVSNAGQDVQRFYVSRESVTGTISETTDKELIINGATYEKDKSVAGVYTFAVGDSGTYLLDALGRIAAVTDHAGTDKYGYLVNLGKKGKGLDSTVQIKIFSEDGEMIVPELADKIRFNGKGIDAEDLLLDPIIYANNAAIMQLIRFSVNDEGKLSVLETAKDGTNMSEAEKEALFTYDADLPTAHIVNTEGRIMNAIYYLSPADTVIFTVPSVYTGSNDKEFAVMSKVKHGARYTNMKLYDIKGVVPAAFVIEAAAQTIGGGEKQAIITKLSKGINTEGEAVYNVELWDNHGDKVQTFAEEEFRVAVHEGILTDRTMDTEVMNGTALKSDVPLMTVKPGDIVNYSISAASGELTNMTVIFRAGTPESVERVWVNTSGEASARRKSSATENYYSLLCYYGTAEEVYDFGFSTHVPNDDGNVFHRLFRYYTDNKALLLTGVFDRRTNTFTKGDYAAITEGDSVYIYRENFYTKMMIAYRD